MSEQKHFFRKLVWVGLLILGAGAPAPGQSGGSLEIYFYPSEIARGKETQLKVDSREITEIQLVEITPPEGVTVRAVQKGESSQWSTSWTITVFAEPTAAVGERTLVLVTPKGRTKPQKLGIRELAMGYFYPKEAARGRETQIKLDGGDVSEIQAVEFQPAGGVTVRDLKVVKGSGGSASGTLTVFVEPEAARGERDVVLVGPEGRTKPEKLRVRDLEVSFSAKQVLRGQETRINVTGSEISDVQSVEVTPAAGVTVRGVRKEESQKWVLTLFAEPAAEPGERAVVLTAPEGRTEPQTIVIPSHVPRLSNLKIQSPRSPDTLFNYAVEVEDEAGDLGDKPEVTSVLVCLDAGFITMTSGPAERVEKKGKKYVVRGSFARSDNAPRGRCGFSVSLKDAKGYESNEAAGQINFQ